MVWGTVTNCIYIVYFYWKIECDQTNANSLQLPASFKRVICTYCDGGTKLDYNLKTNTVECVNCPANTFSTGGSLRLNGMLKEWSSLSSKFANHCYIEQYNGESVDTNCEPWQVSDDKSYISTGSLDKSSTGVYYSELSIDVQILKKGKVSLNYWKLYHKNICSK